MNGAGSPPSEAREPTGVGGEFVRKDASKSRTARGFLSLCLASFGVMAPWPLLAILITHPYFDNRNEATLLLGGITGIPLALLALVGLPERAFLSLIILVWAAAAIVPDFWFARLISSRRAVLGLLGTQATFSLAQAAMGAMMIFGKSV